VDKAERLLDLMIYLLEADCPRTRAQIRWEVEGYGEADSDEAFERMFERDKDDLRTAGVPVEVRPTEEGEDGYLVDRAAYHLPPLDLEPKEIAAAALVARALMADPGFPLAGDLRYAVLKLTHGLAGGGLPARLEAGLLTDLLPYPCSREEATAAARLHDAIRRRKRVTFTYRTMSSGEVRERTVDPYGLMHAKGSWYLVGRDHLPDAIRTFRLSRMEGPVEVDPKRPRRPDFEVPEGFDVGAYGGREWEIGAPDAEGRVAFSPEIAWMVQRHVAGTGDWAWQPDGGAIWCIEAANERRLVDWLLAFGEDAELLAPADARQRLATRLEAAARMQLGGDDAAA
jgi:proteasome accessory factor B